ncbi:AsnC family transcriptional regulator [Desulfovibrio sp. JY]|nr:AsnC family transcriptional regulator [Desulfovibrio sp. JY]
MDATDKRILDIIQTGFPIASRPYAAIGEAVGLTEAETLARVRALKGKGIIRRIGANFQSAKIGFCSTLCAASAPPEKLDAFIKAVNAHPGVTHNYLRQHALNVWFTMIGPSREDIAEALAAITAETGISILNLPADRLFKIRVDFAMSDEARPKTPA